MAVVISDERGAAVPVLQPLWDDTAPRKLVLRCPENDPLAGWAAWQKHLRTRRKPAVPPFLNAKQPAILWGWPAEWQRDAIGASLVSPVLLAELAVGDEAASAPDLPSALQAVALAYALPKLAHDLPAETWWFLVERLHAAATHAHTERVDWMTGPEVVIRNQLIAGELPLALGFLFPELRAMRSLRDDARTVLTEAIIELTDGQGLLHARLLPGLGPLFSCWTRCRWLGEHLRRGAWSLKAEEQYEWLVRHAIRLADAGGRFVLSPSAGRTSTQDESWSDAQWTKPLFRMALRLAGDRSDHAAAAVALPRDIVKKPSRYKAADLPKPSLNSDWAGISVMANGWSPSDLRVSCEHSGEKVRIELAVDGESLLRGIWSSTTSVDGQRLEPVGEWEQLCWQSGRRFDFLELGQELARGVRIERQVLFGREDRILYLADIVRPADGTLRHLQHSLTLPLAPGVQWNPEPETRDGLLTCGKTRAAVLPLSLREWRADPRGGTLIERDGRLVLAHETDGRAFCSTLLIDLDRKRSQTERTWRQLTIAEWMEIVPNDVAAGFRAQSGDDQWLFYRSIAPAGNRTLLGHNVAGEFCAGRFVDGKFKEWVEIEAV